MFSITTLVSCLEIWAEIYLNRILIMRQHYCKLTEKVKCRLYKRHSHSFDIISLSPNERFMTGTCSLSHTNWYHLLKCTPTSTPHRAMNSPDLGSVRHLKPNGSRNFQAPTYRLACIYITTKSRLTSGAIPIATGCSLSEERNDDGTLCDLIAECGCQKWFILVGEKFRCPSAEGNRSGNSSFSRQKLKSKCFPAPSVIDVP